MRSDIKPINIAELPIIAHIKRFVKKYYKHEKKD